jgi:hypothetical protein
VLEVFPHGRTTDTLLLLQFIQQRPRVFQIRCEEAFGKPIINLCEHLPRFGLHALPPPQPGEARHSAQFKALRTLLPADFDGPVML